MHPHATRCCGVKSRPEIAHPCFGLSLLVRIRTLKIRALAQSDDPQESSMSKGNDKKPKTAAKTNAGSAYKAAQSQDKQPVSPFAKKPGGGQLGRKGK